MQDNLTNYDRFVLSRRNGTDYNDLQANKQEDYFADLRFDFGANRPSERKMEAVDTNSDYENYLINELRRTSPSDKKVMREDEYNLFVSGSSVAVAEKVVTEDKKVVKTSKLAQKLRMPRLTKNGKIILVVYIILMIALASILIVSNTTGHDIAFNQSANASPALDKDGDPVTIRAMSVVDEEEGNNNWFDKLCDSLNK